MEHDPSLMHKVQIALQEVQVVLMPNIAQAPFQLWGQPELDLLLSLLWQHYYTLESPLPLEALGMNTFNHPWTYEMIYVFSPSALVPPSSVQASARTCHKSVQTSNSSYTLLDGGFFCSSHRSQHKTFFVGVLS